jgi:hypothetical protein
MKEAVLERLDETLDKTLREFIENLELDKNEDLATLRRETVLAAVDRFDEILFLKERVIK